MFINPYSFEIFFTKLSESDKFPLIFIIFEQNLDIIFKFDSGVFSGTTTIQSLYVAALYVHRDIPALPDEEVKNLL